MDNSVTWKYDTYVAVVRAARRRARWRNLLWLAANLLAAFIAFAALFFVGLWLGV